MFWSDACSFIPTVHRSAAFPLCCGMQLQSWPNRVPAVACSWALTPPLTCPRPRRTTAGQVRGAHATSRSTLRTPTSPLARTAGGEGKPPPALAASVTQKSSLVIGYEAACYDTESRKAFTRPDTAAVKADTLGHRPAGNNLTFGTDAPSFTTSHRDGFPPRAVDAGITKVCGLAAVGSLPQTAHTQNPPRPRRPTRKPRWRSTVPTSRWVTRRRRLRRRTVQLPLLVWAAPLQPPALRETGLRRVWLRAVWERPASSSCPPVVMASLLRPQRCFQRQAVMRPLQVAAVAVVQQPAVHAPPSCLARMRPPTPPPT